MKKKNPKLSRERQKKIISLVFVYKNRFLLAALCMVIVAGANGAMAFLVKPIMDDIFIKQNRDMLLLVPGAVILAFFLKGFCAYGSEYFMKYIGQRVVRVFRDSLYEKITDLPISFVHNEKIGTLMSRITSDVDIIKNMVSNAIINVFMDFFSIIAFLFVVFYRDWQLAIGAFMVLPLAFYPIVIFGRRIRKFSTGTQETMADLNSFLQETFVGNKIIKIFNLQEFEKKRFKEKTKRLFRFEMKKAKTRALSSPLMEFLGGFGVAFVIWFGGMRVINGTSTPGTFFSFLTAVMMLYGPVKKISKLNNTVQEGAAAASRIFDVLEEESLIVEKENPDILKGKSFNIEFNNVSFAYSEKDAPALNNINLKVAQGEILALVGMSGGGKTSLVNLVPRLYDVTRGSVLIAGKDIKDYSIKSLRDHVAIVTQEPILFNESVRDNIRYGKMDATDIEIEKAAKAAFAFDFIQGFPKGFDTIIGEFGSRLSGGEKQRICIARALIKDAPILILDEATSALDSQAESVVQKALENLMKGRTSFVIAHRLSTINYASRIILLKNGSIKEQGTHDELMALQNEYFKLQTIQATDHNKVSDPDCVTAC